MDTEKERIRQLVRDFVNDPQSPHFMHKHGQRSDFVVSMGMALMASMHPSESMEDFIRSKEFFESEASKAMGIPHDLMGFDKETPRSWIEEREATRNVRRLARHVERRKTQLWLESLDVRPWWAVQLY